MPGSDDSIYDKVCLSWLYGEHLRKVDLDYVSTGLGFGATSLFVLRTKLGGRPAVMADTIAFGRPASHQTPN